MFTWIEKAYFEVYPFDSYDPVQNTISGKAISRPNGVENPIVTAHKKSLYTKIASFFNLPTRIRKDSKPGLLSSLKSWFFWPDNTDASIFRKIAGVVGGTLLTPFKLLSVITGTLLHTLMLVTEFLPLALQRLCEEKLGEDSVLAKIFGAPHFIGRAITSPITGIRMAFKKAGIAGWALAGLSAAVTIILYTALAPFALIALFKAAATLAPQLLTTFFTSPLPNALYMLLDLVMSVLMPLTNYLITLGMSFGSAIITTINLLIGFSIGAFVMFFGPALNAGANWIENLFNGGNTLDEGRGEYAPLIGSNTLGINGELGVTEKAHLKELQLPNVLNDTDTPLSSAVNSKDATSSSILSNDEESDNLEARAQLTF